MTDGSAHTRINFDVVQRSRGGSAVKTAAYIACARLEYDDTLYDFRRKKSELVHAEILLPAGSPTAYRDPAALWGAAEAAERRHDAQVARQVLVSIPRECPRELWPALARAIVAPYVADGAATQVAVHCPRASDGAEQPHLHAQITLRRVTPDGLAPKKTAEWNSQFREGQGRAERARISDRANKFFAAHGLDITLDPRRLADRGIDRTPEPIAPAQDWQRWLREGARPDARPITVEQVFRHRESRRTWERATAAAAAWGAHADTLDRQIATTQQQNDERVRAAAAAKSERQNRGYTQMARKPIDRNNNNESSTSWARRTGGWDALSDAQQQAARAAHERWRRRGGKQPLDSYVAYVQDRRVREVEEAQEEQQPDGIAPASSVAAERNRTSHLERLLAERYQTPSALAPYVRHVDLDTDSRTATLHTAAGRIMDHGDRITSEGSTSPELAAAIVAAAAAKNWQSIVLTGSAAYREAVAQAAALHIPPLTTDHELSGEGRAIVQARLHERAQAAVPVLPDLTAMPPPDAARARIEHEREKAQAALAGEPQGELDPRRLAAPKIAEAIAIRDRAREDAAEASAAAAAHREHYGWSARLLDPAARRRQAALDSEAAASDREARRLDRGHDRAVRRIEKEAQKQARANEREHATWTWSRPVRQAQTTLVRLDKVSAAVNAGDEATVQAAATTGSLAPALAAAEVHQQRQAEAAAEQERARLAARTPAELKRDALSAALSAENQAKGGAEQEAARRVTAAVARGDTETIAAAANGDLQAAAEAAEAWQEREREAEEDRRERALAAMLRESRLEATGMRFE